MPEWFSEAFRNEFEHQASALGRFNLAVFGKTGVGKSTLVNAIFGAEVARTGIGRPVTEGSHVHIDDRGTLGVIDTKGLEVGRDDGELIKDVTRMVKDLRKRPLAEQVHAAWYCVRGMDRRFETAEADFITALAKLDVPVLLVLTQVPMRDGVVHPDALALAQHIRSLDLPIVDGRVFFTYAMRDPFSGQPAYGLGDVLQATFQVVPEAVHQALAASQQIDLNLKARVSQTYIGATVAAAAATAATPIPFADAAILVPLQFGMMARVARIYGIDYTRASLAAIASTTAATTVGRASVTSLIKLIPGAGSVAGGVISASVASSFTLAIGEAWLTVCQRIAGGGIPKLDGVADPKAVSELFQSELKSRLPKMGTATSPEPTP